MPCFPPGLPWGRHHVYCKFCAGNLCKACIEPICIRTVACGEKKLQPSSHCFTDLKCREVLLFLVMRTAYALMVYNMVALSQVREILEDVVLPEAERGGSGGSCHGRSCHHLRMRTWREGTEYTRLCKSQKSGTAG